MRLLRFLFLVGLVAALSIPQAAFGAITALTESELGAITGQAGVRIEVDDLALDTDVDQLHYGDDDSGWLSLNEIQMSGSVDFKQPMVVETVMEMNPFVGHEMEMIRISISDMEIRMDDLSIGSITLGPNPGEGPSLGGIGMTGFFARISGNVRIWAQ